MKLLLDTHIWIWSALDRKRLSKKVTSALESPKNELWLSPVSVWELLLLVEKGRVELDRPPARWITDVCAAAALRDAPLTETSRSIAGVSRFLTRIPPIASSRRRPGSTS